MPQMKMYFWLNHLILIQIMAYIFYMNKFYLMENKFTNFIFISKKSNFMWSW